MANITGLITVNQEQIIEVDADPSAGGGTPAPVGSLAMFNNVGVGILYWKVGSADTAWTSIQTSQAWALLGNALTGTSIAPNEFMGSTNDFDVVFKRNSLEGMRLAGSTAGSLDLLIGLNASVGGRLQLLATLQGDDVLKQMTASSVGGANIIKVSRQSKVLTTDATITSLFAIATPTDSVCYIHSEVVARQTGGSSGTAGDGAVYVRDMHARNIGGTANLRNTQTTYTSEDQAPWNNTFAASGANIVSSVVGQANKNISWYTHVELLIATT